MSSAILVVRVYVTESRARLRKVMNLLRESGRLRGMTVFKGIAGFGPTMPESVDPSEPTDPPVVLEFFDDRERVAETIAYLKTMIAPHHIITFPAEHR
ncbi:MAG: DUF190 domain-containing protein [Myxococcales bacterium]|nr:DUF190 domain-containing protein [Myxococcales bacterium]